MEEQFQLAIAAHRDGHFDVAERAYRALPNHRSALHNLGVLYRTTGRYDEAEAIFRRILTTFPDDQGARNSLAHTLLAVERFEEAWPFWEARRRVGHPAIFEPQADYPEWSGEPVRGKRVVVCAEHGLGDQVLFGRYLALLRDLGAEVTVACKLTAVGRLFDHAGYATCQFVDNQRTLPPADYWVFIASLPLRLGVAAPPPPVYLRFPAESGGGLGVIGQGNAVYAYDRYRSLPADKAVELEQLGRPLDPAKSGAGDVFDTARIVAGLDGVISTDTLAPNLAGSIGKPISVLLSKFAACWRWGVADRSPWYPAARLYRQESVGNWAGVLERLRADLPSGGHR